MLNTDIVLMSGFPASGKSSLNAAYEDAGYLIICRDVIGGSMDGIFKLVESDIKVIPKLLIDATFPTIESRKKYIELAKAYNKTIGCHAMTTSKEDSLINAMMRVKKITGDFYFYANDVPKQYSSNPQVYVYPAIFRHSKLIVKNKVSINEGFDKVEFEPFIRRWDPTFTNKAVFIDLDSTVRETISDAKWPIKLKDQTIMPNSKKVLLEWKKKGYLILAVSNQSDVNKGKFIDPVDDIIKETNDLLGGLIDDYRYCPHSIPAQICTCRKPQSGTGLYFMDKYKLDLSKCYMVGDRTTDKTFATRLGIKYFDHKEFFNR